MNLLAVPSGRMHHLPSLWTPNLPFSRIYRMRRAQEWCRAVWRRATGATTINLIQKNMRSCGGTPISLLVISIVGSSEKPTGDVPVIMRRQGSLE